MSGTDWITEGAHVAESAAGGYAFTTVKRITATLVVLDNGSRYKRDTMRKVGEHGKYNRTWLRAADEAYHWLIQAAVGDASAAVGRTAFQVREKGADPVDALDQMAVDIESARRRVAELVAARAAINGGVEAGE